MGDMVQEEVEMDSLVELKVEIQLHIGVAIWHNFVGALHSAWPFDALVSRLLIVHGPRCWPCCSSIRIPFRCFRLRVSFIFLVVGCRSS
jgi:hypothetical protein